MHKLKVLTPPNSPLGLPLRKMNTANRTPLKLETLNNEMFKALREKTVNLKKEKVYVHFPKDNLNIMSIEKTCPLTFLMLKHKYKIDTTSVQIGVVKNYVHGTSQGVCAGSGIESDGNNQEVDKNDGNGTINNSCGSVNFLDSFVQFNIPVLSEYERVYFFKHIIEIIDTLAADVVYRHSIGGYKKNDKYNFVTVLFNNLKVCEKSSIHHEFCFSLSEQIPLTINCYIVHSGNTSYILKLDFFQEDKLVFDIFTTFVNINSLTFKPQEVVHVNNSMNVKKYDEVNKFACHLKDVQNLFNHKDVKCKCLHQDDIYFVLNFFKNAHVQVQNKPYHNKNAYVNTNIYDEEQNEKNTLSLIENVLGKSNLSFYVGKNSYYCNDSYIESNHFISSEFKNIHNFTFGGYLAYLSFCHAMTVIKHFIPRPVLIEINEIQYILPVPYNSVVSFRGKIVYSDEQKIHIKVAAYTFDFKKKEHYLTTIFDLSFENNSEISFIPQSGEEVKLYLFSYIRSHLVP
ncbi:hypothetical protein, conserved [Plasmodium ovale curtisi]|uniref:HotDog ACOT-type domain-containing protein n=1 Tax=Plasmodium ovale curtisi TaxID=864141 RepID=A0A1A8VKX3_PLAOA|nr:hypothetical protein, conserved [Plasmodium ovale curtisi]